MSVYVDDMFAPYGRMKLCHLIADSPAELTAFAERIGLSPAWRQFAGTDRDHFDVSVACRVRAVAAGAAEITKRDLARRVRKRRGSYINRSDETLSEDALG